MNEPTWALVGFLAGWVVSCVSLILVNVWRIRDDLRRLIESSNP